MSGYADIEKRRAYSRAYYQRNKHSEKLRRQLRLGYRKYAKTDAGKRNIYDRHTRKCQATIRPGPNACKPRWTDRDISMLFDLTYTDRELCDILNRSLTAIALARARHITRAPAGWVGKGTKLIYTDSVACDMKLLGEDE